jgi:hypothetical protein
MLSIKNSTKVKLKPYIKEQDSVYYGLLKLARVSDKRDVAASLISDWTFLKHFMVPLER